jgi:hypothetical protein
MKRLPVIVVSAVLLSSPLLACTTVTDEMESTFPCILDGKQVGTYTRALQTDGTLVYIFDEGCNRPYLPSSTN